MKKLNKQEISDVIVNITYEYIELFFLTEKVKLMDKKFWAALHIGFIAGMKLNGYSEKELLEALDLAQEEIMKK